MPSEPRHPKTREVRAQEVAHLTDQLRGVGLPDEVTEPIVACMLDFQETGHGFSRSVRVPGSPLCIKCLLSNQAHITSHIRITRA